MMLLKRLNVKLRSKILRINEFKGEISSITTLDKDNNLVKKNN